MNIVRITIAGQTGFGSSFLTREQAETIIGKRVLDFFGPDGNILPEYRSLLEFPLLDCLGQISGKPVLWVSCRTA
jgi:L-rhamnonate dehydratase